MRNVEFSHTDLTDLTDFYSFGVFAERQNENPPLPATKKNP